MPTCKILKSGLWTSIQDIGRQGYAYYAVPQSGVMDRQSAKLALSLLNLPEKTPLIECTMTAPTIQFNDETTVVLSGAHMNWQINNKEVSTHKRLKIKQGDILSGTIAKEGLRSYIAIKGLIKSASQFDSCSSYLPAQWGYNHGRPLKKNHTIIWEEDLASDSLDVEITISQELVKEVTIYKGPEYDYLDEASKNLLNTKSFSLSTQSNRMGARLNGPQLKVKSQLVASVAVLPGIIQLPPSGQPIVILQDGQTTGGYPRIAYIQNEHLSTFNQLPFNRAFRFNLI